jgi:hypothetical protein
VFRTPPIFVAAGIEAVMYLGYGAFLGFLPIYAKRAGLNDAEIAIVLGAQLAMAMVAKPITGRVLFEGVLLDALQDDGPRGGHQLYRFSYTHEVGLIALTAFDILVMTLIWHEYGLVRRHLQTR